MRRRLALRILALSALVLALAGCVRVQAELVLTPDDTVDGTIVVAVVAGADTTEARQEALARVADLESALLGSLPDAEGVSTRAYDEDGYLGSRITLDDVALAAFSGQRPESFRFERDDDEYAFHCVLDFTAQSIDADDADPQDLRVSITFPGEVSDHNGELSGTTVTWTTTPDQRLEMRATGGATPPGPPVLLLTLIGIGVLVVAAGVLALVIVVRRRAARRAAVASAVGDAVAALPAATPDPAVAGPVADTRPEVEPAAEPADQDPPAS